MTNTADREAFEVAFPNLDLSGCTAKNVNLTTGESKKVWLYHKQSTQIAFRAYQARQPEIDALKQSMQRWIDHHCERADKAEAVLEQARVALGEMTRAHDTRTHPNLRPNPQMNAVAMWDRAQETLTSINAILGKE